MHVDSYAGTRSSRAESSASASPAQRLDAQLPRPVRSAAATPDAAPQLEGCQHHGLGSANIISVPPSSAVLLRRCPISFSRSVGFDSAQKLCMIGVTQTKQRDARQSDVRLKTSQHAEPADGNQHTRLRPRPQASGTPFAEACCTIIAFIRKWFARR